MKRDKLVLISGLGSSLPLIGRRYTAWANRLNAKLKLPNSVDRFLVSSDGAGEKPALKAILKDHREGLLGTVVIGGHSNGARDSLFMIEQLYGLGIRVRYAFSIDMTLGEFGAEAFGNIDFLDEFHAQLQRVDFDKSFVPSAANYKLWEVKASHVASASTPLVQGRLKMKIEEAFR